MLVFFLVWKQTQTGGSRAARSRSLSSKENGDAVRHVPTGTGAAAQAVYISAQEHTRRRPGPARISAHGPLNYYYYLIYLLQSKNRKFVLLKLLKPADLHSFQSGFGLSSIAPAVLFGPTLAIWEVN